MLLQIQKFELNVVYRLGKELLLTDALSRSCSNKIYTSGIDEVIQAQVWIVQLG